MSHRLAHTCPWRSLSKLSWLGAGAFALALVLGMPMTAQAQAWEPDGEVEALLDQVHADRDTGLALVRQRGEAGDVTALNLLGSLLMMPPDGEAADPIGAEAAWRQAIALGDQAARLNLATHILLGTIEGDPVEALALLDGITKDELLPYTAYPLGRAYMFGHGVPQDLARGSRLMLQAAEVSPENIDARFLAGRALQNGWGIPADPALAREHLRYAADRGVAPAQWNLGLMLLDGKGGPADAVQARRYVRMSAENGFDQGQISMAVMLALGQGGPVDAVAARVWYGRAMGQGSAHAMRGLGMMMIVGEGGPVDATLGWAYLELAAEAGDGPAIRLIAHFTENGVEPDRQAVDAAKADHLARHGRPSL